jgi:type I restriction enzyme S subunit
VTIIGSQHFPVRRLRYVFDSKSGSTPSSSVNEYWDGDIYWVTPEDLGKLDDRYINTTRRCLTEEGYESCGVSLAPKRSLVLSKRAPIGQVAILNIDASCNQGCFLLTKQQQIDERFYYYALIHLRPLLEILGRGSTFMELSTDDFRSVELPFPTMKVQQQVADYLDRETARIDALIAEKEQMLTLLDEKRSVLISQAVTRGLDPDVPMKYLDFDWLGGIPQHWSVCKLKYLTLSLSQGASPQAANTPALPDELGILKLSAVSKGKFKREENKALATSDGSVQTYSLEKDDVLITRGNTPELVADVCYVPNDEPNLLIPDLIYRLKVDKRKVLPAFLTYFLTTKEARTQIQRDARGSSGSMVKISQGHVLNWLMPLPLIQEQTEILDSIKKNEQEIQSMVTDLSRSIEFLKEKRTAVITAAVTGQLSFEEMAE